LATRALCGGFFDALYVVFASRDLGLPAALVGVLVGLGGVGALLGAAATARITDRVGLGRTLVGAGRGRRLDPDRRVAGLAAADPRPLVERVRPVGGDQAVRPVFRSPPAGRSGAVCWPARSVGRDACGPRRCRRPAGHDGCC
jgi:hypothetical protein